MTQDSAGNLYGTTRAGGAANKGVVFKLDSTLKETVLHSFTGGADGEVPLADVTFDAMGNLYGTTSKGGTANCGVVYRIDAAGHGTVLYSFQGASDGATPLAGVVVDSQGNLYGTTDYGGGAPNAGVVYKVNAAGNETVLYRFGGGSDGKFPVAGVVLDTAGTLYGTTKNGGKSPNGGVVFKLSTNGHETVLHNFTGGNDGLAPKAGVVLDSLDNIYGTTWEGGSHGAGVVYKVSASGKETVLYSFMDGADGGFPLAGVILDSSGNLYGTTNQAGDSHAGVVFKIGATGGETVLASFPGGDGNYPSSALTRDSSGDMYGTTSAGGTAGEGTLYKLNAAHQETVLYSFSGGLDGGYPAGGVVLDAKGNLYGVAAHGGAWNAGVVYEVNSAGLETVLYNFTGGYDGSEPQGGVVFGPSGNLYGAAGGGASNMGVVYTVDLSGQETVLHSFNGTDGSNPAAVTFDAAGNLYGAASQGGISGEGVVYKIDAAGTFRVLYTFMGLSDGGEPLSSLTLDSAGNLYGTTFVGGTGHWGVVYLLSPSGNESVLYNFTGGADGGAPLAGVTLDAVRNIYGTTSSGGGTANAGVVFELSAEGQDIILHSFTGGADGKKPAGGVIRDSAGNLYGATADGGAVDLGVVFELKAQ